MAAWPDSRTARALVELGVTDVLVLERDTVGSGGSGKSSGIVRCHYGIPSLAAMAWHALPVLEHAGRDPGRPLGLHQDRLPRRRRAENLGALRANVAMHQQLGIEVELVGHDTAQELWPAARLDDFAEFAYEPRGGYGDGHQTALAFAVRGTPRRGAPAPARRGGRDRGARTTASPASVLADGSRIGAAHVVLAAGPWSAALAAGVGRRPARPGPAGPDPPRRPGPAPRPGPRLLRPGVAAVRAHRGGAAILLGDSDHSDPEWSDPDDYRERVERRRAGRGGPQVRPPLPRPRRRRRCRRPTPAATT